MKQYVNAGGKFVQGLANRRNEEASLLGQFGTSQKSGGFSGSETEQFRAYNGNSIPEEYKTQGQKQEFLSRLSEWQNQ